MILRARAHAKVNLHLGVEAVRDDGFHELATVFQSLDISDEVSLEVHADEPTTGPVVAALHASGTYAAGVPEDESNLAWRAVEVVARAVRADRQVALPRVTLHLQKGIPAAGGMAGGSANAAAALRLAAQAFADFCELSEDKLYELAAELGSDVPFTLMGGTALGTGRGEQLAPMMTRGTYTWAIITNAEGLPTPVVFHKIDELRAAGKGSTPAMDTSAVAQALMSGQPQQLAAALRNDLQAAAVSLRPDLRKILDTGKAAGALAGIVSGSGPTCAFLCEDEETAGEVVAQVMFDNKGTRGIVTHSPAPGIEMLG
ncbi:4-(cytidine 5'-diphospho)-2-C-methyl-D-erythritol kinase [Corynebacterium striatum]